MTIRITGAKIKMNFKGKSVDEEAADSVQQRARAIAESVCGREVCKGHRL